MAKNNLFEWDATAGNNTDVSGVSIAEGMAAANVNNAMRAMMAQVSLYLAFQNGGKVTTGSSNAYAVASGLTSLGAYEDGMMFAAVANHANTGAATLNVDSIGAKAIRKLGDVALQGGEIAANRPMLVVYDASANSGAGAFMLIGETPRVTNVHFDSDDTDYTFTSTTATTGSASNAVTITPASGTSKLVVIQAHTVGPSRTSTQALALLQLHFADGANSDTYTATGLARRSQVLVGGATSVGHQETMVLCAVLDQTTHLDSSGRWAFRTQGYNAVSGSSASTTVHDRTTLCFELEGLL